MASHFLTPTGAATFLTGPLSYLYLLLVAVSGYLFDFRLSVLCGLTAAAGYLLSFLLARSGLAFIAHPDPLVVQDLVSPAVYGFRGMLFVFAGFVVGGLAVVARRLASRVLHEEVMKREISRLLGEYVSEEVREKLLSDPPSPEGEVREVTILFSDIRGFTALSERVPAKDLVRHLNAYFEAMGAAIS